MLILYRFIFGTNLAKYKNHDSKCDILEERHNMKISVIKRCRVNLRFVIILFALLAVLNGVASAEIIPSERKVTWQGNVGVDGDIPTNYTKYGSTIETGNQSNDTTVIQNALNAASKNQYVLLGEGNFTITGTIKIPSGVILRGAGINKTTLVQSSESAGATIAFGSGSGGWGTSVSLSGSYSKGKTSITTSSSHGWSAGDIILIDQLNGGITYDPPISNVGGDGTCTWCGRDSGTRSMGQYVELSAASGNTAKLDIPLYFNVDSGQSPQGAKVTILATDSGVEHLKIDNSKTMNSNQYNSGTVTMDGTSNCWLYNVEIYGAYRMGVKLSRSYRATIRNIRIHHTSSYTSNYGYGMWLLYGASACLIENSVFDDLSVGVMLNGPTSGNVFGYCYIHDMQSTTYPNAVRGGFVIHGAHPIMNLFEGNYLDGVFFAADSYWGTSSHNTYFRNRILVDSTKTQQEVIGGIDYRSYYYNVVGNVLGDGRETSYILNDVPYGPNAIFAIEYNGTDNTRETTLIHYNFDYYHDTTTKCDDPDNPGCQGGTGDTSLPDSMYLTSKPAWWGSLQWPAIGSDLNPMDGNIPAQLRYDNIPQPPARLRTD